VSFSWASAQAEANAAEEADLIAYLRSL